MALGVRGDIVVSRRKLRGVDVRAAAQAVREVAPAPACACIVGSARSSALAAIAASLARQAVPRVAQKAGPLHNNPFEKRIVTFRAEATHGR